MLSNSPMTIWLAIGFLVLVFILNSFSVLVTYMMSSVTHLPHPLSTHARVLTYTHAWLGVARDPR